ncbi:hypothetical protein BGZ81_002392 [Podila clonocystis]|nr:hypothetical protein BGZ81_002392 [Podila clonocystis]
MDEGVGDGPLDVDVLGEKNEADEASRWEAILARALHGYHSPLAYDQEQDDDRRCYIPKSVAQIPKVSFLIHTDGHREAPMLPEAVAVPVVVPVEVPVEALRDIRVPEKIQRDDRVDTVGNPEGVDGGVEIDGEDEKAEPGNVHAVEDAVEDAEKDVEHVAAAAAAAAGGVVAAAAAADVVAAVVVDGVQADEQEVAGALEDDGLGTATWSWTGVYSTVRCPEHSEAVGAHPSFRVPEDAPVEDREGDDDGRCQCLQSVTCSFDDLVPGPSAIRPGHLPISST